MLYSRLVTGLSAHGPAQRAGAQRLRALAHRGWPVVRNERNGLGRRVSEARMTQCMESGLRYESASASLVARPHFATCRVGLKHRLVEAADAWRTWSAISVYLKQSPPKIGELLLSEHRVVE
jgi:hypothetical protein